MQENATKDRLIELLYFPRQLVYEEVRSLADNCPHELRFAGEDDHCLACDFSDECQWLNDNDEFSPLESRSTTELVTALGSAITYVRGDAIAWGHGDDCSCQVCEWMTKALSLYDSGELSEHKSLTARHRLINKPKQAKSSWQSKPVKNFIPHISNLRIHLLKSFQCK